MLVCVPSSQPWLWLQFIHEVRFLYEAWAFQMMVNPRRDFALLTIIRDFSDELLGLAAGAANPFERVRTHARAHAHAHARTQLF